MSLLSLEKVSLSVVGSNILSQVDLQVSRGERIVFVGPNGLGKSALLELISGERQADQGSVHVEQKARIGMMGRKPRLDDDKTVLGTVLYERADLVELRARIERLADDASSGEPKLLASLAELKERYDREGGDDLERRVALALEAVGFDSSQFDQPCGLLTVGERFRLSLARVLAMEPDLLLLDDPTSYLDIQTTEFLERYLASYSGAALVVSHDRAFYESFADQVFAIDMDGTMSSFQAKEGSPVAESQPEDDPFLPYREPEHSGKVLFFVKRATVCPGDQVLLEEVTFQVGRRERIGIIGSSGCGKSTLLKALAGDIRPQSGQMGTGFNAQIGRFDHEDLGLSMGRTVLEELLALRDDLDRDTLRQVAERFLFVGDEVELGVDELSDDARSRLALALLVLGRNNVLLLDEPLKGLNLPSRRVLERALADFPGTVIVVSNDRRFLDRVATRILSLEGRELVDETGPYSKLRRSGKIMGDVPREPKVKDLLGKRHGQVPSEGKKKPTPRSAPAAEGKGDLAALVAEQEKAIEELRLKMADPAMALNWEGLENLSNEKKVLEKEYEANLAELKRRNSQA